jgi:hypothetical protein
VSETTPYAFEWWPGAQTVGDVQTPVPRCWTLEELRAAVLAWPAHADETPGLCALDFIDYLEQEA